MNKVLRINLEAHNQCTDHSSQGFRDPRDHGFINNTCHITVDQVRGATDSRAIDRLDSRAHDHPDSLVATFINGLLVPDEVDPVATGEGEEGEG